MRYVMQVALMMLLAILGSVGVVGIVLHLVPNDVFPARDAVAILQGLATVAAVALGALFAYRNSLLFRSFEPHLTVSHDLSHRRVGQSYVHIGVTATLHNSSKVKVEIRQGEFLLQQIAPITDAELSCYYPLNWQTAMKSIICNGRFWMKRNGSGLKTNWLLNPAARIRKPMNSLPRRKSPLYLSIPTFTIRGIWSWLNPRKAGLPLHFVI